MVQDIEVPVVEQGHVEPRPVGEGLDDLNAVLADGVVQSRVSVRVLSGETISKIIKYIFYNKTTHKI